MHKRNKECHTSCHQRQQQKAPDGVKVMKQHETYMLNKSMSPWRQLSAKVAPFHRVSPPDKKTTAISFEGQPSHPLDVTKGFNQFVLRSLSLPLWLEVATLSQSFPLQFLEKTLFQL